MPDGLEVLTTVCNVGCISTLVLLGPAVLFLIQHDIIIFTRIIRLGDSYLLNLILAVVLTYMSASYWAMANVYFFVWFLYINCTIKSLRLLR